MCRSEYREIYYTFKTMSQSLLKVVYFYELSISSKEHVYLVRSFERPKELQLSNTSQVRKDKITLLFFLHDQPVL